MARLEPNERWHWSVLRQVSSFRGIPYTPWNPPGPALFIIRPLKNSAGTTRGMYVSPLRYDDDLQRGYWRREWKPDPSEEQPVRVEVQG